MTIDFEQRYLQHLLHTLAEMTQDFLFEPAPNEPEDSSLNELRLFRLYRLLDQVKRMVNKRFYQLPESFREMQNLDYDDWMQEAMVVLIDETQKYDIAAGVPYQKYITSRIKWRLIDKQRTVDRQHSLVNEHVKDAIEALKQQRGHDPTPDEIAEYLGCEVWAVQEALEQRRFVRPEDQGQIEAHTQSSPHDEWLRKRLWECIERLEPDQKELFVRHEMENESFPALFREFCQVFASKSIRSFQRHYGEQVFEPVRLCVEQGYD